MLPKENMEKMPAKERKKTEKGKKAMNKDTKKHINKEYSKSRKVKEDAKGAANKETRMHTAKLLIGRHFPPK